MSASTGTIQRPMATGSILGAIAVGVATLFAVGALAWGAINLSASKQAATPVAAPAFLDKGSRGDALKLGPMPYSPAQVQSTNRYVGGSADNLVGKPGNVTPQFTQPVHPRHIPAR
jgi:hypothetical protein